MNLSKELIEEMELLVLFNLDSAQAGLKVHQHSAALERIAAARRLFEKGLITQEDGGFLTMLGIDAAEHAQALVRILQGEAPAD